MATERVSRLITQLDWSLVVLVSGYIAAHPAGVLLATAGRMAAVVVSMTDQRAYEAAVATSAVKRLTATAVTLDTIEATASEVDVVTMAVLPPRVNDRGRELWVTLPKRLRSACAGAADPQRRLQQVLGLPRNAGLDVRLYTLRVRRQDLSRPCMAEADLSVPSCGLEPPPALPHDADTESLRKGYDHMRFIATTLWTSYRSGFSSPGYPFTGMGWTHDWSKLHDPVGVSEFIVGRSAEVKVTTIETPAEFCAVATAKSSPSSASTVKP